MSLIFDTSIVVGLSKNNKEIISKIDELRKYHPYLPSIPFIGYFEFLYGLESKSPKNKEKLLQFIEDFDILPITRKTAKIMVELKQKYEKRGLPMNLADLIIASQVIENKMILVTADKDFEKIEELEKIIV